MTDVDEDIDDKVASTAASSTSTVLTKRALPPSLEQQLRERRKRMRRQQQAPSAVVGPSEQTRTLLQQEIVAMSELIASKMSKKGDWLTLKWPLSDFLSSAILILEVKLQQSTGDYQEYLRTTHGRVGAILRHAKNKVSQQQSITVDQAKQTLKEYFVALGSAILLAVKDYDSIAHKERAAYLQNLFEQFLAVDPTQAIDQTLLPERVYDNKQNQTTESRPQCKYLSRSACSGPCQYDDELEKCIEKPQKNAVGRCSAVSRERTRDMIRFRRDLIASLVSIFEFADAQLVTLKLREAARLVPRSATWMKNLAGNLFEFSKFKVALASIIAAGSSAAALLPLHLIAPVTAEQTLLLQGVAAPLMVASGGYLGLGTTLASLRMAKMIEQASETVPECKQRFENPTQLALSAAQQRKLIESARQQEERKKERRIDFPITNLRLRRKKVPASTSESLARIAQAAKEAQEKKWLKNFDL